MTKGPIRTCVLGVGLAGLTFHVPFILALPELFTLHAVLERNPQGKGKLFDRFGVEAIIHRSIEDVVADPEIELVIVGTPNDTHYKYAKTALQAGKHVLVDKPVTATADQAKELGELSRSKNLVLYGFQNRRWDSDFLALRRLLDLPESHPQSVGHVHEFESRFDRYRDGLKGTWKDEPLPAAGQLFDLGTHLIHQTLVLFGRPSKLTAFTQNTRGLGSSKVEDTFTLMLQYPAGSALPHPLTAILRGSILSVKSSQLRYVVRGTKGTFTKYGVDGQEDQLKAIASPNDIFSEKFGLEPESIWGELETLQADGSIKKSTWPSSDSGRYVDLFRNLADAIRNGAEPEIKWADATLVIELVELAHQSAREGRTLTLS